MGGFRYLFMAIGLAGKEPAQIIHDRDEDGDEITCSRLNVVLKRDSLFWYAQGVEIDYVAQGDSIDEAKRNFLEGLRETLLLNMRKFGTVEKLLKWAPVSEWKEELTNAGYDVSFSAFDDSTETRELAKLLPSYGGVRYRTPHPAR